MIQVGDTAYQDVSSGCTVAASVTQCASFHASRDERVRTCRTLQHFIVQSPDAVKRTEQSFDSASAQTASDRPTFSPRQKRHSCGRRGGHAGSSEPGQRVSVARRKRSHTPRISLMRGAIRALSAVRQTRTLWSQLPEYSVFSSRSRARASTVNWWPRNVCGTEGPAVLLSGCHLSPVVREPSPEFRRDSCWRAGASSSRGESRARQVTRCERRASMRAPGAPGRAWVHSPRSASQHRIVRSSDAEKSRRPSLDTTSARTAPAWPENILRHSPSSVFQLRIVKSSDPVIGGGEENTTTGHEGSDRVELRRSVLNER